MRLILKTSETFVRPLAKSWEARERPTGGFWALERHFHERGAVPNWVVGGQDFRNETRRTGRGRNRPLAPPGAWLAGLLEIREPRPARRVGAPPWSLSLALLKGECHLPSEPE